MLNKASKDRDFKGDKIEALKCQRTRQEMSEDRDFKGDKIKASKCQRTRNVKGQE
jgi:hypothetical protein